MSVVTYNPEDVLASFGAIQLTGFAPDKFLSIEFANDFYTTQVGADGKSNTRSKSNNRSATFTFSLLQTSPANDLLSAGLAIDELNGAGVFPLFVLDKSTGAKFIAENAWIQKSPNAEFGAEAGSWDWVIATDRLIPIYGDPLTRVL